MPRAVTMQDVATHAGVSKATVSNAFNRPQLLQPALRAKVEAAARELGYHGPDPKGRILSSGQYGAIGVVLPGKLGITNAFANPYIRTFLSGVASLCEERGKSMTVISGADGAKTCGARYAPVDGFILHGMEQAEAAKPALRRNLPVVVIDFDTEEDTSSIRSEDRAGGWLAARHLLQLGHRDIAIALAIFDDQPSAFHEPNKAPPNLRSAFPFPTSARIAGISDALHAAGLSIDAMPIIEVSGFTRHLAQERGGIAMLFDRAPQVTGVITLAGHLGLAVLDEARRRGLGLPNDLSIVTFGGSPDESDASPPLTAVQTQVYERGRAAARMLLDGGPKEHLVLPFELVVRGSTAPPRTRLPV